MLLLATELTVVPLNEDAQTGQEIARAWWAGQDFRIIEPAYWRGYVSINDLPPGILRVVVRYGDRKLVIPLR